MGTANNSCEQSQYSALHGFLDAKLGWRFARIVTDFAARPQARMKKILLILPLLFTAQPPVKAPRNARSSSPP